MPAVSKKQQRFFGYLLSNPEERKKKGISKKDAQDFAQNVQEVSPPGWGHTKAEKEKTKPDKPKSKIGGSAAAFKRALDDGRFKGLPGDKTKKEKTASMFKLMWSMKKKGDKPHYKPGTDEKKKKYQQEEVKDKQGLDKYDRHKRMIRHKQDKYGRNVIGADYNLENERKAKGWKSKLNKEETTMKDNNLYGNAYAGSKMPNVSSKDRGAIKKRAKNLFKRDLKGDHHGVNEGNLVEPKGVDSQKEVNKATRKAAFRPFKNTTPPKLPSFKEGKCDDCTCEGCGPDGVGHQNPCVECGGHHKEEKVNEKYGDTFDTPKQKRKTAEREKVNKERDLRMKHGKKWKEYGSAVAAAKNRLKPGEVKKLVDGKWVSNKR